MAYDKCLKSSLSIGKGTTAAWDQWVRLAPWSMGDCTKPFRTPVWLHLRNTNWRWSLRNCVG